MNDTVLHVAGASPYDVVVGHALGHRLPAMLGHPVARVAVVRPAGLGDVVESLLPALKRYDVLDLTVPDGEAAKTADVAADCWRRLGEAGFTRSDAVMTVGGGATTDLCGFVADPRILELVEQHDPSTLTAGSPILRELVERAIRVKIDVVTADLRETGGADGHPGREVLNYGHTLAHAVEKVTGYTVR